MWIAVDDTDGPTTGCTTDVLTSIVLGATAAGFDLIGYPRLVRLNPNVPWKTRGNAALAARFGHGRGRRRRVGANRGVSIWSFPRGGELTDRESRRLERIAWATVLDRSSDEPGSDPAMVVARRRPRGSLYRRTVSELVPVHESRGALRSVGARTRQRNGPRGLVGASAALAWPARRRTFELIAYREPARIGLPRTVDPGSVREAETREPGLALNYDPRTRRLLVAPHSGCPILFGLRSRSVRSLQRALPMVRSETVERWMMFETNQGTGDHLVLRGPGRFPRLAAGRFVATVRAVPDVGRGGHVAFPVGLPGRRPILCRVFEPTKTLPHVAASLRPGDRVEVAGGRAADGSLHVERLTLLALVDRLAPPDPPRCPGCGRRARSAGTLRGYRCRHCHRRFPPESAGSRVLPPRFGPGRYDPTPSARRHLHPWPRGA